MIYLHSPNTPAQTSYTYPSFAMNVTCLLVWFSRHKFHYNQHQREAHRHRTGPMAASRRESRSATTGLNTLQEFENRKRLSSRHCLSSRSGLIRAPVVRKTFRVANDRLAKYGTSLIALYHVLILC
jgi:hypothetical protein